MIRSGRDRLIDNSASPADQRGAWVSLDHLVGAGEKRVRHIEAQRFGGREINDKFELCRLLNRYIAGLRSAQNHVDIICRASEPFRVAWSVGHKRAAFDKIAGTENRWQPRAKCRRNNAYAIRNNELIDRDVKCVRSGLEGLERGRDILGTLDYEWRDFQTEHACRGLGLAHFKHGLGIANIEHDCQPVQLRDNLTQEFYSFAGKIVRLDRQSSDVAARLRKTCDQAAADRVDTYCKDDGDNRCRLSYGGDGASDRDNDIDLKTDKLGAISA
jgi:hypothetical protein